MNEKIFEEYFYEHYKKQQNNNNNNNKEVDKNGREYMLFRTDVYFSEYLLAIEMMKKNILTETFWEEKTRGTR